MPKEGINFDFNVDKIGSFSVTEASGLAAPVTMSFAIHNDLKLFCISALTYRDFEIIDTEEEKEKLLKKLNEEIKLDNRCFTEFGKYPVLVGGGKFVERPRGRLPSLGLRYQFG